MSEAPGNGDYHEVPHDEWGPKWRAAKDAALDPDPERILIPCREYDPPSLRCWPCAQGRPEDCQDPIVKEVRRG